MRALRARVSIQSSSADVFHVLTNFDAYSEWNPWLKDIKGQAKEGTLVSARPDAMSLFGWRLKYRLKKIQGKDFLLWQAEGWFCFLLSTVREYQVFTRMGGAAIYSIRLSFHGPLAHVVGLLYGKIVRNGLLQEALALKQYCEAHYPLVSRRDA